MLIMDIVTAIEGFKAVRDEVGIRIKSECDILAQELEAQAKTEAPWTDRTGNARRTLEGISLIDPENENRYYVGVCGNMPYSPNLEFCYNGEYAILCPVVNKNLHRIVHNITLAIKREE